MPSAALTRGSAPPAIAAANSASWVSKGRSAVVTAAATSSIGSGAVEDDGPAGVRMCEPAFGSGDGKACGERRFRGEPATGGIGHGAARVVQRRGRGDDVRTVAALRPRLDGRDVSGHPPREVEVVDHLVHQHAAGSGLVVEPVGLGSGASTRHPKDRRSPDEPAVHRRPRRGVGGEIAHDMGHVNAAPGDPRLRGDGDGLVVGPRERLLADHMSAAGDGRGCDLGVRVRRCVDDVAGRDELVEAVHGARTVARRELRGATARRVDECWHVESLQ